MTNIQKSSYLNLGSAFYSEESIEPLESGTTILFNKELAQELQISEMSTSGLWYANSIPKNLKTISLIYAGHQFGRYNPQLGDGRAAMLGEVILDDKIIDLQLKGSGPTRFSRDGDGHATISSTLREYLVSEAMHALGIPTTRSLAVAVGADVAMRTIIEHRGILTRTASSHIRIGSFEYFAAKKDYESIKKLADYTIDRNFPKAKEKSNKYIALFEMVCERQARLVAKWMSVGFIHGVMNTDNIAISGETLDYGPCAFMDEYSAGKVFSYIDKYRRYAYNAQADIMLWNLTSFANCIAFLLAKKPSKQESIVIEALNSFAELFREFHMTTMLAKIGLKNHRHTHVISSLLSMMEKNSADFTLSFRYLSEDDKGSFLDLFENKSEVIAWLLEWENALKEENTEAKDAQGQMLIRNPIVIPRNHIITKVLDNYKRTKDITEINEFLQALKRPFEAASDKYAQPPLEHEKVHHTFCGT